MWYCDEAHIIPLCDPQWISPSRISIVRDLDVTLRLSALSSHNPIMHCAMLCDITTKTHVERPIFPYLLFYQELIFPYQKYSKKCYAIRVIHRMLFRCLLCMYPSQSFLLWKGGVVVVNLYDSLNECYLRSSLKIISSVRFFLAHVVRWCIAPHIVTSPPQHNKWDKMPRNIAVTSYWLQRRPKSPASPLFAQLLVQVQIKENIKALWHWPLWGEFTGYRWIPNTKGQ